MHNGNVPWMLFEWDYHDGFFTGSLERIPNVGKDLMLNANECNAPMWQLIKQKLCKSQDVNAISTCQKVAF